MNRTGRFLPWAAIAQLLAILLMCLLGSDRPALSQEKRSKDKPERRLNRSTPKAMFQAADVTEDGFLSGKEAAPFKRFDTDGNGRITKAEFLEGMLKEQKDADSSPESVFKSLDVNEDERLTGTELATVRHLDSNGDGRVTREEFLAGGKKSDSPTANKATKPTEAKPIRALTPWDRKLAVQFDGGKRWAVIIGVNAYREKPLRYCVPDARMLAEALQQRCGYDPTRTVILTDDQKETEQLPTKINIQKQLGTVLRGVGAQDTVLVFFAGHGFSSDGQSFLCPLDFAGSQAKLSGWRLDELRSMLHDCSAAQKLLVLDCCHSGGAVLFGGNAANGANASETFEEAQGLLTFASCRTTQTSLESQVKGHGVFSYSLARGLRGAADFDSNGIVDSDEIYRHLISEVPVAAQEVVAGHKQTPVRIIGQDVVGVFALSRPDGVLEPEPKTGPAKPQVDEPFVNSIGMKMVVLPKQLFAMGSPSEEYLRNEDERLHPVIVAAASHIHAFETTQQQYEKVMGANPSYFSKRGEGAGSVDGLDTARFPVEQLTWHQAKEFCRRLSELPEEKKAGRTYRLPTEAEWEFACRGGTLNAFHTGDLIDATQANIRGDRPYWNAKKGEYLGRTRTVGAYPPNSLGLYDMHGNVAEWCEDWYSATAPSQFFGLTEIKRPSDTLALLEEFLSTPNAKMTSAMNPTGPRTGAARVFRGGSFSSDVNLCRSAARRYQEPDFSYRANGFRVVLTAEKKN